MNSDTDSLQHQLKQHPRLSDLAQLVHVMAISAAEERRMHLAEGAHEAVQRLNLASEDIETPYGNVLSELDRQPNEPLRDTTRELLGRLCALGVHNHFPKSESAEKHLVEQLIWLASRTLVDAFPFLDAELDRHQAERLWCHVADVVRQISFGTAPFGLTRADALMAVVALRSSSNGSSHAQGLADEVRDPALYSVLRRDTSTSSPINHVTLDGVAVAKRRSGWLIAFFAISGLWIVIHAVRAILHYVFRYRRTVHMDVTDKGISVRTHSEWFGRPIRTSEVHYAFDSIARVEREVRQPQLRTYIGLLSLGVGTYMGVSILADGFRAASGELIGVGAIVFSTAVALDFVLMNVVPKIQNTCRLVLSPKKGKDVSIGNIAIDSADRVLRQIGVG